MTVHENTDFGNTHNSHVKIWQNACGDIHDECHYALSAVSHNLYPVVIMFTWFSVFWCPNSHFDSLFRLTNLMQII